MKKNTVRLFQLMKKVVAVLLLSGFCLADVAMAHSSSGLRYFQTDIPGGPSDSSLKTSALPAVGLGSNSDLSKNISSAFADGQTSQIELTSLTVISPRQRAAISLPTSNSGNEFYVTAFVPEKRGLGIKVEMVW